VPQIMLSSMPGLPMVVKYPSGALK
jgi:hypothetical protein